MRQTCAIKKALRHCAAAPTKEVCLALCLNAFGDSLQAQRLGHGQNHLDNGRRLLVSFQSRHELAIDLEDIKGQLRQDGQV